MSPCAHHRHPRLEAPVSKKQFRAELADTLHQAGIDRPFTLRFAAHVSDRHQDDERAYAEVQHDDLNFAFADAALWLPRDHRLGLMAHEVGHVLDPLATENGADRAAEAKLGIRIVYDRRWPGKGVQMVTSSVENGPSTGQPSGMLGYKVMRVDGGKLRSGADSRQNFPLRRGTVIRMPGSGVFLSPNREYVLTYYSGLADHEALLTLQFDPGRLLSGNLTDREPEVSVREATVVDYELLAVPNPSTDVMLAKRLEDRKDLDVSGWWMSEKLDGVRAVWDGKRFVSRKGNEFAAPTWFKAEMPKGVLLDGELYGGRGEFDKTSGTVRRKTPGDGWKKIVFTVFDAPELPGTMEKRRDAYQKIVKGAKSKYIKTVTHKKVRDRKHLDEELKRIEKLGGEGIMLAEPGSAYERKRSGAWLKVKSFYDAEAKVVGHVPGKGKHQGVMGALRVETPGGKRFKVGTGFSDAQRRKPPKVGDTVTYSYFELTKSGTPRFPSFLRVRKDEPRARNPSGSAPGMDRVATVPANSLKRRLMR